MILARKLMMASVMPPIGGKSFTLGTHSFVVPPGVLSICGACIGPGGSAFSYVGSSTTLDASGGGGALAWRNNIPVTPGETLTVVVTAGGSQARTEIRRGSTVLVAAAAGRNAVSNSPGAGGAAGDSVGTNRYTGGTGDAPLGGPPHGGSRLWPGFNWGADPEWRGGRGVSLGLNLATVNTPGSTNNVRRNGANFGGGACKRASSAQGDGAGTPANGFALIIWGAGRGFASGSLSY